MQPQEAALHVGLAGKVELEHDAALLLATRRHVAARAQPRLGESVGQCVARLEDAGAGDECERPPMSKR